MEALKGRDGVHDHFAPLGLWSFVSQVPRALPWAFTLCAFGTERFVSNWRSVNSRATPTPASIAGRPVNNLLARWTGIEWIFSDHPNSLLLRSPVPALHVRQFHQSAAVSGFCPTRTFPSGRVYWWPGGLYTALRSADKSYATYRSYGNRHHRRWPFANLVLVWV